MAATSLGGVGGIMNHGRGFTLIELLIVLAIVAILAAIAYPSYLQYLIRSNRSVAKADLVELQQWLERNYSLANRYDQDPNGATIVLPFSTSPRYQGAIRSIRSVLVWARAQRRIRYSPFPKAIKMTPNAAP